MTIPHRMARRTALKWMLTAAASTAFVSRISLGQTTTGAPRGYGTDPDLIKLYEPGDVWPLTLTEAQRITAAALCDTIIPADNDSPAASTVGVVDFLDEWISAPYPDQVADRGVILPGLDWIDEESRRRFSRPFAELDETERHAICDDICFRAAAVDPFKEAARFFALYRDLTAGGYYTTPAGSNAIGYIGNMPLAVFDGPSDEVLRQAGVI
jgi:hypothetical protein